MEPAQTKALSRLHHLQAADNEANGIQIVNHVSMFHGSQQVAAARLCQRVKPSSRFIQPVTVSTISIIIHIRVLSIQSYSQCDQSMIVKSGKKHFIFMTIF